VRQAGNRLWQYVVLLVAVATPILGFFGALKPEPHDRSNVNWEAIYWTIGVVVVAIAWFVVVVLLRPANVRAAASHAAEHRGVAALDERLDYEPLPENEMPL
jgi:protein-S-isoprenylcysteine O-methyltransferase Ste14